MAEYITDDDADDDDCGDEDGIMIAFRAKLSSLLNHTLRGARELTHSEFGNTVGK